MPKDLLQVKCDYNGNFSYNFNCETLHQKDGYMITSMIGFVVIYAIYNILYHKKIIYIYSYILYYIYNTHINIYLFFRILI